MSPTELAKPGLWWVGCRKKRGCYDSDTKRIGVCQVLDAFVDRASHNVMGQKESARLGLWWKVFDYTNIFGK